ncbi:hypothetical protein TrST_g2554 [Triparma strigata]|uniref:Carboxypeptidase n=1 Tax=Triparma strigata TaxID=1606541 RepID=A0A9W7EAP2_9STRA|nr:hypothetical protein TrST_g2554 [Triparma strigata]
MYAALTALVALSATVSSTSAIGSAGDDKVTSLPNAPPLPSNHYSGYLTASSSKNIHYYLVESENDPANDPLLIWMNGGPGCSSLDGFLYEHGPYRVNVRSVVDANGNSVEEAYLEYFEQSWSKLANTLYIEAPVGVGFSYSTAGKADYNCTDDTTADDNLAALHSFYEKFPQFMENDLFITGESYAGVYVPTLAENVLLDETFPAKLKGIAVGNGCSGTEVGICSWGDQGSALSAQFLTSSGFLPQKLKNDINDNCDYDSWFAGDGVSEACTKNIENLNEFTKDLDTYCVYCDCPASNTAHSKIHGANHLLKKKMEVEGLKRAPDVSTNACINTYEASLYLNRPDVQEALSVTVAGVSDWEVCHTAAGWDYTSTRPNLPRDTYPLLTSKINVLVYNGDWDACVPYTDGESWTSGMGFDALDAWHTWKIESGDVGGYATKYDVEGKFQFVTVKGGRHEVPETEPVRAYEMLQKFLAGEDF